MPPIDQNHDPQGYWRSLAELADSEEYRRFVESEFPAPPEGGGLSRRRWLQLMGASLALAGVAGCRWEKEEILPFAERPDGRIPGTRQHFATVMDLAGAAVGLLVTCQDGRPIKVEGNRDHPQSLGASSVFAQASILELYDPDRSRGLVERASGDEIGKTWDDFADFGKKHFGGLRGDGDRLRVLCEASSSPTLAAIKRRFHEAFPNARWHEYEPISRDNERSGAKLAFGKHYRTHYCVKAARVIACLDADLLGSHPASLQYARELADGRDVAQVGRHMNRLYAVESGYSITGAAADHRLAVKSGAIGALAAALHAEISRQLGEPVDAVGPDLETLGPAKTPKFLKALAKDLVEHQGQGIVAVGPSQPPEVHALVHHINADLGNAGKTLIYYDDPDGDRPGHVDSIRELTDAMRGGHVDTLLILGGNPAYNAPADLGFAEALVDVPTSIHLSLYRDETSRACKWHLPRAHFLESWGDARSWDGTYSVGQPMIEPLWGGRSAIEVLAMILGESAPDGFRLVERTFLEEIRPEEAGGTAAPHDAGEPPKARAGSDPVWRRTVHDGLLGRRMADGRIEPIRFQPQTPALAAAAPPSDILGDGSGKGLEIVFGADPCVYDGRFANSGWLQELPAPLSKVTWDNVAVVSPRTAGDLGVQDNSVARLSYRGKHVELPVYIMPGQADGSVSVQLGYGRTAAGKVGGSEADGIDPVGADLYALRTGEAMHFDGGLALEPTGRSYRVATTQDHHAIDKVGLEARAGRIGELIREAPLDQYVEHPEFAKHAVHVPPLESPFEEPKWDGNRWAMAIDLSRCIGCNACVVACQAENNIPVVGRQRVREGREMHWIRLDRYFRGKVDDPRAAFQPMPCQQCELAPCEQVCPVGATVHSKEGLNDMAYNRCVGTRYCANNCPYKVRRFNYFNYRTAFEEPENEVLKMAQNPEVTIRSRGVMEKCTYCVQRIQAAKIDAKNHRRAIGDGEIRTACQQACPTQAIVFGDLKDPNSRVSIAQAADRAYAILAELNVKPRTQYLARIRNPNPDLDDADS